MVTYGYRWLQATVLTLPDETLYERGARDDQLPATLERLGVDWCALARASDHLGTPWHTKAGVFTPREVVGPWVVFTVKRR